MDIALSVLYTLIHSWLKAVIRWALRWSEDRTGRVSNITKHVPEPNIKTGFCRCIHQRVRITSGGIRGVNSFHCTGCAKWQRSFDSAMCVWSCEFILLLDRIPMSVQLGLGSLQNRNHFTYKWKYFSLDPPLTATSRLATICNLLVFFIHKFVYLGFYEYIR